MEQDARRRRGEVVRRDCQESGSMVGVHLKPHDLRRHAATYASRSGVPIEIVSKVTLRHANLPTTQHYLGKVSNIEASDGSSVVCRMENQTFYTTRR